MTQTITVNALNRWTDALIDVRAGDVITFNASGVVVLNEGTTDVAAPGGLTNGRKAADSLTLNQPAGGLVARIGNYGPIWVGDRRTLRAPVSGRLALGINDDYLPDNRASSW